MDKAQIGVGILATSWFVFWLQKRRAGLTSNSPKTANDDTAAEVVEIQPVEANFDWRNIKPRPYRPFKAGPFHLTMAIKRLDPNEWLLLEDSYQDITERRAQIVAEHTNHTVLSHPMADEPLKEMYEIIMDFMTSRYPMYFVKSEDGKVIRNEIKGTKLYADPAAYASTDQLLRTLAMNLEEDFLVMMLNEEDNEYYLRGGTFAHPSGFDPAVKLNTPLKEIHGPVPGYKEKLQLSMDKYFKKMKLGSFVERFNWSMQTHSDYYVIDGNHNHTSATIEPLNGDDLDFDNVFLRCERQTLSRLPRTKAIVFTIRTYLTPLSQIRTEGRNADLIEAIDNLPEGMAHYKKREEWGEAVKAYLRYETDGITTK